MNISYNWLKDLVEINLPPQELASKLTGVGLAVEGIHEFGDDFVFDIDLTSNRSDCLSHWGVSREIAAIMNGELSTANGGEKPTSGEQNLVSIQDTDLCNRFTARIIRDVKIAKSPEWLINRLEAVGERSINNVADITNFVMHELGQPMHSFDLNKLKENRIVVRRARNGETIKTLDETERKLDETMLAICDAENPVAVAGVMGGIDSAISDETTAVLLEVAYFTRENIRQTSRKLNLTTEASYRFERGVDIENLVRASNRATELICDLAGGNAEEFVDIYPVEFTPHIIDSNDIQTAVKRLTGLTVEKSEVLRILNALGIEQKSETIYLSPSWRHDLAIEEDLVEEVARVVGFDLIAEELPATKSAGAYQPSESLKKSLRRKLIDLGFDEAISYSFIDTANDEKFELIPNLAAENSDEKFVSLHDSIIEGATRMRPTLLAGLLDAVRTNFNFQKRDLKLFEIGKVFSASEKENDLPTEREVFSLVLTGNEVLENKALPVRALNFYDAKGAVEAAIDALKLPPLTFTAGELKHLQKGQAAKILSNDKQIGSIGRLNTEIAAEYKFKQPVFVAEIDLETLLAAPKQNIIYQPLAIYPSIVRDASLLVKRDISFTEIQTAIRQLGFELCRSVGFVDVYEGKGISDNERSMTIRLTYRSNERTLLDVEVDSIHKEILQNVEAKFGSTQRV